MASKTLPVTTDNPTAVVVDTNAFPHGRLTRSAIKSLRTLTDLGLHVIVPDIVCRELASHGWQDYVHAQEILMLSDVDVSGIDQPQKIYNRFVSSIEATGTTVAESSDSFFRLGLHAQILRTAPASPKGSVTTGAADYIVYLHALAATDRYSTVAVVTSDKALRTALASRPGIQIFDDFASVRKGDVSHMRLPLSEALQPLKHLLSKEFEQALAEKLDPAGSSPIKVVGVGDILRLNETEIVAYVDVATPTLSGLNGDYYGHHLNRWQVSLEEDRFSIGSNRLISSDDSATWPRYTTPLSEFLSTELSMVPSVLRPVSEDDFINRVKTPLTFCEEEDDSLVEFSVRRTTVAEIHYSTSTFRQEHQHDGEMYIDETLHTEILLLDASGTKSTRLAKGALAVLLMKTAIDLLTSAEGIVDHRSAPEITS